MNTINSKKQLAIILSKINLFKKSNFYLEQYPTDSEIASEVLWFGFLNDDIEGKTIADLGAGTGVLGIGALLLSAKKVIFVEKDLNAIKILQSNLDLLYEEYGVNGNYEIITNDISNFSQKVDLVIQNPPFGTKNEHIDRLFLEIAMRCSNSIYSFHKTSTQNYIIKFMEKQKYLKSAVFNFKFPLKNTMTHHKKKIQRIEVSCFKFIKK